MERLVIVGVGLIGGSIGLAAKRRAVAGHVVGVGRNRDSLERALQCGTIDAYSLHLNAAVKNANMVVFCTPVDRIAEQVLSAAAHCAPGTLLTDAGSTKSRIVAALAGRLPAGVHFVGGHPLAGSEKRGAEFADADLFQDRWTVVTPTPETEAAALEQTKQFWEALGARVRVLSPEEHDRVLALTSHLPHLAASALAALLPAEFVDYAATGFRDTTRIAAGEPELWTAIFEHNRTALLESLGKLENRLAEFRLALEKGDVATMDKLLSEGKKLRDSLFNDASQKR